MTKIELYTAQCDNSGKRREAGSVVEIGTGKDRIDAATAKTMIDIRTAVDASEPAPKAKSKG